MANIAYADLQAIERLPIDAQDVVTKVTLVVAGNRGGPEPLEERCGILGEGPVDHWPRPVTYEYEAPEHATYGASKAFALPEGVDPFLEETDELIPEPEVLNVTNAGDPSAVRDGDATTYAEATGTSQKRILYSLGDSSVGRLCVGFKLRYSLTGSGVACRVLIQQWDYTPPPDAERRVLPQRTYEFHTTESLDDPNDVYAVTLRDARGALENWGDPLVNTALVSVGLTPIGADATWRVHNFYPLMLNEVLLEDIAKKQIRLPAQTPRRVTVSGYVAPEREHTIVGWPGGDYTARVAQVQYELGRTVIDFEQAGAPVGLSAESIEAARERRVAIDRAVRDAAYPVTMGERQ